MEDNFYTEQVTKHGMWWSGNYPSWSEANKECLGYAEEHIVDQIKGVVLRTKDDPNHYERDGCVIGGEPEYAFELLNHIKESAVDGKINLIDFGGSLGTSYYQLRKYLTDYDVTWNIIEQGHFVKIGKETFEDDNIKFYYTMDECLAVTKPNCFISSSVLPYIEDAHSILNEAFEKGFDWILLDRISVIDGVNDLISIQIVPPDIYKAIYPCWFFGEDKLVADIKAGGYEHLKSFDALGGRRFAPRINTSAYRGFMFKKS
jgi:putative methyltransferase (TIGR04325 family)